MAAAKIIERITANGRSTMKEITEQRIRGEAWKFFFVLIAWPLYVFLIPLAFAMLGAWAVIAMVFPGIYLFTWLGYLMHETWHKYVPNIPNSFFYVVFSWMLVTDPQVYRVLHGYHHSQVNTWNDSEFHPLGEIKSIRFRRIFNILEIALGIIFLYIVAVARIPVNPQFKKKYKPMSTVSALVAWMVIYGGIGFASAALFGLPGGFVALVLLANLLLDSIILHQSQLVEHGNLIVDGDYAARNVRTRNLSNRTVAGRIFLFLTHGDSREHVLHHTQVNVYTRPFPGVVPLPKGAVWITMGQYMRVLLDMVLGRVRVEK